MMRPTLTAPGGEFRLFFAGLPVEWADEDAIRVPVTRGGFGPGDYQLGQANQGSTIGLRFASALNTRLLRLRRPRVGVTLAEPALVGRRIPGQATAFGLSARGMVTPSPGAPVTRWEAIGGGTA